MANSRPTAVHWLQPNGRACSEQGCETRNLLALPSLPAVPLPRGASAVPDIFPLQAVPRTPTTSKPLSGKQTPAPSTTGLT